MAESLITALMRSLLPGLILLQAAVVLAATAPENVPDPTRPPASLIAGSLVAAPSSGPGLQSIMISSGRRLAVIGGQTVQVGDKLGDARVVKIAEGEVVLNNGKELQTLKLFPGIEKRQESGSTTSASVRGRRQ